MMEATDSDLLKQFKQSESDEAFARIVERHINLVHSVALRHTANRHHAEEITQAVFIILARRAGSLGRQTVLSGWLYHAPRLTAANFLRSEIRRAMREQEAFMRSTEAPSSQPNWIEFAPLLDTGMARLRPADRDALVLRYFENKSLREVGQALGVEERAAQKRVGRALEKFRKFFGRRGVVTSAAIIAGEISINSVQAVPVELTTKIAAAALKGSAATGSTMTLVKGTLHIMTWLKAKTALIYGSVTLLAAGASLALAHHGQFVAHSNQTKALQEKREAERQGGFANVAQGSEAQKLEAEQKEKELKAVRQQQSQR